MINESVSKNMTAAKAITQAKVAKDQAYTALFYNLKDIVEEYLINIGRQWARRHPDGTLLIYFQMGGMGIRINGKDIDRYSKWFTNFEDTIFTICGNDLHDCWPSNMEVKDGKIRFINDSEKIRSVKQMEKR